MWHQKTLKNFLKSTCLALGATALMLPFIATSAHAQSGTTVTSGMGGGASSTARLQAQVNQLQQRLAAIEACGAKSMLYGGSAFGGTTDTDDCANGFIIDTLNDVSISGALSIGDDLFVGNDADIGGVVDVGGHVNSPEYIITGSARFSQSSGIRVRLQGESSPGEAILELGNSGGAYISGVSNNVGIGTTSPSAKLEVAGNGLFSGDVGIGVGSASAPIHVSGNGIITGNLGLGGVTAPSTALDVTGDGTFSGSVNAGSFFYTSDASMKENIRPVQGGLETVGKLRPVTFKWKDRNETSPGFIAQEVEQVIPEIVSESSDGIKSVDYAKMVAHLVAAVQEQQAEIDALKKEIQTLK